MPPKPILLGLDWGTTSLRAYLIGPGGAIISERSAEAGILGVRDGDFAAALTGLTGDWLRADAALPIIASGMIGSRQGWHEVPYVETPAGAADLAPVRFEGFARPIHFIPGLSRRDGNGIPDVMRGEETQIIGADAGAETKAARDGLYLLPGSHSKWALVKDGRINRFATFMTGELFAALCNHTILKKSISGDGHDAASFGRGVEFGFQSDGILHRLFSARTLELFDELPKSAIKSYISGLLLGAEIAEAQGVFDASEATITIIGATQLAAHYAAASAQCGLKATTAAESAAARGQWRIARATGLLPD